MATINGFHPPMSTLHSQKTKLQVPHATLHSLPLTSDQQHPMLAYQRSSFTKFPYDHQLIRAHHRQLITKHQKNLHQKLKVLQINLHYLLGEEKLDCGINAVNNNTFFETQMGTLAGP
ncbi:PREDICTED: LOC18773038 [Prunus dulcis]|uniref:PREDICTED: LOC18773038 n=1 Tax=Prunus dulcis TaxID=3755 RepID=A0A5E4G5W1_PRUDU|nr:PREDICTED: LOC18773038 [Prunus dulcis]